MDFTEVAPGLNEDLAIMEYMLAKMPFSVQLLQTGRRTELTVYDFRDHLAARLINWPSNNPRKTYLNGKVKHVRRRDLWEFNSTTDLWLPIGALNDLLMTYQDDDNFERTHGSTGCPPGHRDAERLK